jgi:molybdopterin-guanine dinucleotide biosynthesis protein A
MQIPRHQITGLVLAGGRGSRMGGADKGLELLRGRPLVEHVLARLAPQVGSLAINANRHAERYATLGHPVWPDADKDFAGPLAGMLAGLRGASTDWLMTVPCDTPLFPADLVARLAAALLAEGARAAMPVTRDAEGREQPQPVFCLLHRSLAEPLAAALAAGERKIERFTRGAGQVWVPFDDSEAFFNANTPEDLARLQRQAKSL